MNGVKVRFLNLEKITATLKKRATKLCKENPEVKEVGLFGSLVKGTYTPSSDADVLIILTRSDKKLPDRVEYFGRYFDKSGINVEVFPYTTAEIKDLKDSPFIKRILKEKVIIAR